jgi:hypothetical protein
MIRWGRFITSGVLLSLVAFSFAAPATAGDHSIRCGTFMPGVPARADHPPLASSIDPRETLIGPPPNPGVGDTWNWYLWYFTGGPPRAELRPCTVRGMGAHCYVVVDDRQWNVSMNQADVDRIIAQFDSSSVGSYPTEGVWSLDTSTFGQPPDMLDGDPRIYLMYYDIDVADGFFWEFDEHPDGWDPTYGSNECEVIYMDCVQADPGGDYMIAVMAHEFEHMIHWVRDPDEATWVDEGIAEYAMWMYGNPDPLGGFAANPDNDLTAWGSASVDYQQTYLYVLYLHERFGGRPMITTLINESANSTVGVTNALATAGTGQTFTSVFKDWCVANYLDDPSIGDGRYGYVDEHIPHIFTRRFTSYPQTPPGTSVNKCAVDYIMWLNGAPSITAGFNGVDTGAFGLYLVQMGGGYASMVEPKTLTAAQDGSWNLPGFATWVDSVLMVVEDPRTAGSTGTYTFSASLVPTGSVPGLPAGGPIALDVLPNPTAGEVRLMLHGAPEGALSVGVFAADGRRVAEIAAGTGAAGDRELRWNGLDAGGAPVPAGVYWARIASGEGTLAKKILITR